MNTSERLLLRIGEAAEVLGISRSHCYELVQSGKLPTIRLGGSVRIPRAWLEKFVADEVVRWERARQDEE